MTAPAPPPTPTIIAGRYELHRRLAQGGMAEVWLAVDLTLDRKVAVKWLKPSLATDPVVAERFRREAIAAASLSHPNIVAVHDVFEQDGRQAVVMQLVDGKSLRQILDNKKRLSPQLTCHIGACVAVALDHAHQAGFIHRDVKPGNIMLTPDGQVLLTDFGIAKGLRGTEHDLTSDNVMMGTAKYLSPEQVRGKRLDARADLYSLGLVLYECLAGRVPFLGETDADTALARLQRDPTDLTRLRATLPTGLVITIHELLARNPDHRPTGGAALAAALRAAAEEGPPPIDETPLGASPVGPFITGRLRRAPSDVQGRLRDRRRAARARGGSDELEPPPPPPMDGRPSTAPPTDAPAPPTTHDPPPIPGEVAPALTHDPPPIPGQPTPATTHDPPPIPGQPTPATTHDPPPIPGQPTPATTHDPPPIPGQPTPATTHDPPPIPGQPTPATTHDPPPIPGVRDGDPTPPGHPWDGPPRDATPTHGAPRRGRTAKGLSSRIGPAGVVIAALVVAALVVGAVIWATNVFVGTESSAGTTVLPSADDDTASEEAIDADDGTDAEAPDDAAVDPATDAAPQIVTVTAYDPDGDGVENDADAALALADGNPATGWRTVCYSSQFMGGKRGVGLVVSFDAPMQQPVSVEVGTAPFQLQFFATGAEDIPPTIDGWDEMVGDRAFGPDPTTVVSAQPAAPARHVLLLLNELGPDDACTSDNPYRGQLGEISVR